MVIWGTDVIVDHCKKKFTKFLKEYVNDAVDEDETLNDMGTQLPFYMARLEEVCKNANLSSCYLHALSTISESFIVLLHLLCQLLTRKRRLLVNAKCLFSSLYCVIS